MPQEEKARRLKRLDQLQESILSRKNALFLGETVQALVDGLKNGRWQGRTRGDKLVFFDAEGDHMGELVDIVVTKTGPWALQGVPARIPGASLEGVTADDNPHQSAADPHH